MLPPLDVNVRTPRPSCILDVEVALSRHGLLLATRLAEEFDVWLVRALWEILDCTDFYTEPARAVADGGSGSAPAAVAMVPLQDYAAGSEVIRQWEAARLQTDIVGLRLFWAGDARHESLLPKNVDKDLVERLDLLSAELDARSRGAGGSQYDPVREGFRDAAGLAAALINHRPIIFSMSASRGGESAPRFCAYLRDCGIESHRVQDARLLRPVRRHLLPVLARAGVLELTWTGLGLTVVHLLAPNAAVMPIERDMDRLFPDPKDDGPAAWSPGTWFRGASAHWWTVGQTPR